MNVRQKLSLAALCLALPAMASAQAAPAPAAEPAAAPAPAFEVKPYGFLLLTYNQNDGTFNYPEYPSLISSEMGAANVISARQSRLGFTMKNADSGLLGAKLSGKLEFDFMGGITAVTDSVPVRLRYAVATAVWEKAGPGNLTLTVGQTDGLVNALHPELGAYIALPTFMQAGNLTRRSPQIRLGYDAAVGPVALNLEAAVLSANDVAKQTSQTFANDAYGAIAVSAGNANGTPDLEAHLGAVVKLIPDVKVAVGVGYHTNTRLYQDAASKAESQLTATLIGVDANVDATKFLNVRGEFFMGTGSDDSQSGAFTGSMVGGTLTATADTLELRDSTGYWFQATIKPLPQLWVIAGYGSTTLKGLTGEKDQSKSMFNGGVLAPLGKNIRFGLEYTTSSSDNGTDTISGSQIALSSRFSF